MRGDERRDVNVRQRVAVDNEKGGRVEQRQRLARAAGGTEDRVLPRVADAHTEIGSISDDARQRLRQMMEIEHRVGDAGAAQRAKNPCDERVTGHRQSGLGTDKREGTEAGRQAGGQDQRRDHSSWNTMLVLPMPCFSRCWMNRPRYESRMKSAAVRPSACCHRQDGLFASLDLHVGADRRLVERDRHIFSGVFLAVLLVAEPHVQPELLEHALQHFAVADDGLEFVAHFHAARLHRTLEGEEALARFGADAQNASAAPQRLVFRIEQRIFLEAAAAEGSGARRENQRAGLLRTIEPEFDFALEHQRHVGPPRKALFYHKNKRPQGQARLGLQAPSTGAMP